MIKHNNAGKVWKRSIGIVHYYHFLHRLVMFVLIRSFVTFNTLVHIVSFLFVCCLFVVAGLTLFALSENNLALTGPDFTDKHFSVFTAFLFGTICAAVDPVAVREGTNLSH